MGIVLKFETTISLSRGDDKAIFCKLRDVIASMSNQALRQIIKKI